MSWYKPAYNTIDIYHGQSLSINRKIPHIVGLLKEFDTENRSCKTASKRWIYISKYSSLVVQGIYLGNADVDKYTRIDILGSILIYDFY